jgi:DNA-binding CsgD family transcriptional regulator
MPASETQQSKVFAEVKRLCSAGLDETTLLREAIERLRQAVPAEGCCFSATDPSSGLMTRAFVEGMGGEKGARIFFERVYLEEDVSGFHVTSRNWVDRPVTLLSEVTGGKLERSLRYREHTGPLGLHYELRGAGTVGKELWGTIALTRERGRPDFDDREVALLRRLAPHLGAGLRAAVLLSQDALEAPENSVPGVLVLDPRRWWVSHYNATAESLLGELEDLSVGWQEGDLPVALTAVAGAVRKTLKPQSERDRASIPRLCVKTRFGRWLTLQGTLTEARPGHPSEMMVIIEPAGPREITWIKATAYGLSAREKEVVELVVRGASTKQIATTLYISEYTVQDHLSNIFDKVGVRGRKPLVKRLFYDNLYPSLKPSTHRQIGS